jgi:hypothetical protein
MFIRHAVVFIGRKTRFSGENRVHPACGRVYQPKNAVIHRKTRSSDENRVFPEKIAFFR